MRLAVNGVDDIHVPDGHVVGRQRLDREDLASLGRPLRQVQNRRQYCIDDNEVPRGLVGVPGLVADLELVVEQGGVGRDLYREVCRKDGLGPVRP
jgi:hypothetical protein